MGPAPHLFFCGAQRRRQTPGARVGPLQDRKRHVLLLDAAPAPRYRPRLFIFPQHSGDVAVAHKKGQGASRNGRDSNGQRRGIKCYGGETVEPGSIILRQCGTKFIPGRNAKMGRNCDIYATATGVVTFVGKRVHIEPVGTAKPAAAAPVAAPAKK